MHFLSVYFFPVSAFVKCSNDKSNTNRPDLSTFGRADRFVQHRDPVSIWDAKYISYIVLVAPLPSLPQFDHVLRFIPYTDNMFHFSSNQTPSITIVPAINICAPKSSPTPLTKHVPGFPDNMRKNDDVFYRHNKEIFKTINGKKVSLPLESRNQLYCLDKWTMAVMKMTSIDPWTESPLMTQHRLFQSHVHMTP